MEQASKNGELRSSLRKIMALEVPDKVKEAMESTMRVFIDKYADKLANKKRSADEAAPAIKAAKV